jgi:large subunit ribosomal protein L29
MANIEELRGKSPDELKDMALSLKKELFNLRFQVASGELTNTARFRDVRRDVARVKTLLNEPKNGVAPAKKAAKAPKVKEDKTAKAAKAKSTKKKVSGE